MWWVLVVIWLGVAVLLGVIGVKVYEFARSLRGLATVAATTAEQTSGGALFGQDHQGQDAALVEPERHFTARGEQAGLVVDDVRWQPLFRGVAYRHWQLDQPRPLRLHAMRIDLNEQGVQVIVTPPATEQVDGIRRTHRSKVATTFMRETGCQVAINASAFFPVVPIEDQPITALGLFIYEGQVVVGPSRNNHSLLLTRDGRAVIARHPYDQALLDQTWMGVSGFGMILHDGQIVAGRGEATHPRTLVGTADDGRTLILLVIDGRQEGYSEGATYQEAAGWLRDLGAIDGLAFDGGGSTTMVMQMAHARHSESAGSGGGGGGGSGGGGPRIVNRPINAGIPGMQRPLATHLGIFAQPLPK